MKIKRFVFVFLISATLLQAEPFQLKSPELTSGKLIANEQVFNGFGCSGGNISPALSWTGLPKNTKSIAITVYDPDAPTGSGWWHWVVFNIPATTTSIPANAGNLEKNLLPKEAIQSRTDFGMPGYGGPCPPQGHKPHRYYFTVYALKDRISADQNSSGALIGFYINSLKIGEAKILAKYGR
ncbi:YbhB/YbcL family Raf kinase inhibitor-like protein [Leptospira borgpetersenii]|uniref:YbhB/YbcL family Raf kinase inhibitor-like protein n=1 Tax=Leptospira borgpetersenii TaxID=174 RepID=UPI0007730891|nr:YbhB/YbcL family Raf kinase inhibitor-like protein [Leptospira borgpetersenii]MBE8399942.1 YbhB/YbcL family Raf kinase inhibitor-like protein [Leptospira borgpetersenii serovar Tarassovi]MBE8402341.1 YbhB/YbcL family Raf kinase inhibitor-like protein [Leptospira borgpetersenii serovar Tarassovi]MBE8406283.1 YbhB/YbcL family Raf kinase inhibitor-like protein [Leptospira borgpetersenii serovar Tarassovi]MBE8412430.1 YbhB/YbcL family Raf kinase inhibitor-like protein [Leptospira borgpetersenii 